MVDVEPPGPTPLQLAAYNGYAEICALLLQHNADPSLPDRNGDTPLHLAVMSDDVETCRAVLAARERIEIDAPNKTGKSALDVAQERFADDMSKLLMQAGAKPPGDSKAPRAEPPPLVSDTAPFLSFVDVPEPADWLREQIKALQNILRVPSNAMSLRWAPLDFWPDAFLLAIRHKERRGRAEQFALVWPNEEFVLLDWTLQAIWGVCRRRPPQLEETLVTKWCRFVFHFTRPSQAQLRVVEHPEDIPWTQTPDSALKEQVCNLLQPLRIIEVPEPRRFLLGATVIHGDSLRSIRVLCPTREIQTPAAPGQEPTLLPAGALLVPEDQELIANLPVRPDGSRTHFG